MWNPMRFGKYLSSHAQDMRSFLGDDFRDLDRDSRKQKAGEARNVSAAAAAAVVTMPIPFADIWTITPIQVLMVRAIGNIYGCGLDYKTARALIATVGGGWLGQQTFLGLLKLGLPGIGEAAGAGFAYLWTIGMGKAAEAYFASGMQAPKREFRRMMTE